MAQKGYWLSGQSLSTEGRLESEGHRDDSLTITYDPMSRLPDGTTFTWEKFSELESEVDRLREQVEALSEDASRSEIIPIGTFAPEPYKLVRPIQVVVTQCGDAYIATFLDANVRVSGDTQQEAYDQLKCAILDTFDLLTNESDSTLGPDPLRHKRVLCDLIVKIE